MRRSAQRIPTSHAGSLPRPDELIELNRARQAGESKDEAGYQERLRLAVEDVVRRQKDAGVDIGGDGEYGKAMGQRVNYGTWWSYSFQRLGGLELGVEIYKAPPQRSDPGHVRLTSFPDRRDRQLFPRPTPIRFRCSTVRPGSGGMRLPVCRGPLTYAGQAAGAADIAHFKAGTAGRRRREASG
jgi:5-methyltetrahydropteroyltriglutamate--homocysteine methyltransferase